MALVAPFPDAEKARDLGLGKAEAQAMRNRAAMQPFSGLPSLKDRGPMPSDVWDVYSEE